MCAREAGLRGGGGGGVCGLRLMTLFISGTRALRSSLVTAVMRGSLWYISYSPGNKRAIIRVRRYLLPRDRL